MSESRFQTIEELQHAAAETNLICILPEENELQVDLDAGEINERIIEIFSQVGIFIGGRLETISQHGRRHVYFRVTADEFYVDDKTRILLQACLGSDPVREALSLVRLHGNSEVISALFETESQAALIVDWRQRWGKL